MEHDEIAEACAKQADPTYMSRVVYCPLARPDGQRPSLPVVLAACDFAYPCPFRIAASEALSQGVAELFKLEELHRRGYTKAGT